MEDYPRLVPGRLITTKGEPNADAPNVLVWEWVRSPGSSSPGQLKNTYSGGTGNSGKHGMNWGRELDEQEFREENEY